MGSAQRRRRVNSIKIPIALFPHSCPRHTPEFRQKLPKSLNYIFSNCFDGRLATESWCHQFGSRPTNEIDVCMERISSSIKGTEGGFVLVKPWISLKRSDSNLCVNCDEKVYKVIYFWSDTRSINLIKRKLCEPTCMPSGKLHFSSLQSDQTVTQRARFSACNLDALCKVLAFVTLPGDLRVHDRLARSDAAWEVGAAVRTRCLPIGYESLAGKARDLIHFRVFRVVTWQNTDC